MKVVEHREKESLSYRDGCITVSLQLTCHSCSAVAVSHACRAGLVILPLATY